MGKRRSFTAPGAAIRHPHYYYRLLPSFYTVIAGTTTGNLPKSWNGSGDGEMRSVHANDLAPTPTHTHLDDGRLQLRSPLIISFPDGPITLPMSRTIHPSGTLQ